MTDNKALAESIRNYLENGTDILLTDNDYKTIIKALEQEPTKEEKALLQKWRDNRGIGMEEFGEALNELQKPKTEYCKWIKYDYRTICPKYHDNDNPYWRIPDNMEKVLKYCPYCGKEIEVSE